MSIQQRSLRGDPDKLLVINGQFIALELKSKAGKPSPLQLEKLKQMEKCGALTFVVTPESWPYVKKQLRSISDTPL